MVILTFAERPVLRTRSGCVIRKPFGSEIEAIDRGPIRSTTVLSSVRGFR